MSESEAVDSIQVRVWFGEHTIASYIGDRASALRDTDAMRRRFPSLQVSTRSLWRRYGQR
jgi:hypothetical protein